MIDVLRSGVLWHQEQIPPWGFPKLFQNSDILCPAEWHCKLSICKDFQIVLRCLLIILDSLYPEQWKNPVTLQSGCMKDQKEANGWGWLWRSRQKGKETIFYSVPTAVRRGYWQKCASGLEVISSSQSRSSVGSFVDSEFLLVSKAAVPSFPLSLPAWCTAWKKTAQ